MGQVVLGTGDELVNKIDKKKSSRKLLWVGVKKSLKLLEIVFQKIFIIMEIVKYTKENTLVKRARD